MSENVDILNLDIFNKLRSLFGDNFSFGVDQYTTNALKNVQDMEQALQQGDAEVLERAAHSLKSASGQFGALVLSGLAAQMEVLGRNADFDNAQQVMPGIRSAHEQAADAMVQAL